MFLIDGRLCWSASDLASAATCEFAVLRKLDRLGVPDDAVEEVPSALQAQLADAGKEHERRVLDDFVAVYGEGVVTIERVTSQSTADLTDLADRTKAALEREPNVVFQAGFFDGEFHGYADFLRNTAEGWVVADTKIARRAKTAALLQVAAYADQLETFGLKVAPTVELILGTGDVVSFPRADLMPVFRERRNRLRELIADHRASPDKAVWSAQGIDFCGSCSDCSAAIVANDDLLQVANLRKSQRTKLKDAGVHTVSELAAAVTCPQGLTAGIFERLTAQAKLQKDQLLDDEVRFVVFDPKPILALPDPSPGDLFFDFEGDPIYHEAGSERWGLEYLWGVMPARNDDGTMGRFWHLWADDRTQEKIALIMFLNQVAELRADHPGMHVYHYAAYEISALKRLVAEFKVHENELDDLLRHGVFVDLYATVRNSIRVSQSSYSIKKLEPLYMSREREGLAAGDDSIVQYGLYREKLALGNADLEKYRADLLQYNRYDCESTLELQDWLRRQIPAGTMVLGAGCELEGQEVTPEAPERLALKKELLARSGSEFRVERDHDQQAWAMLESALDYHRREDKPFWWGHFDRLIHEPDEWAGTKDVLVVDRCDVIEDWGTTGKQRNQRRTIQMTGRPGPGSTFEAPGRVRCLYSAPTPPGIDVPARGLHGATKDMALTALQQNADGSLTATVTEVVATGQATWKPLPLALVPTPGPDTRAITAAIVAIAQAAVAGGKLPSQPAVEIFARAAPRAGPSGIVRTGNDEMDLVSTLLALDCSYLAVQGPPGTGKTYLGSLAIKRLVEDHGWRIGVVAQSHAVVENLLDAVVEKGLAPELIAKRDKRNSAAAWVGLSDPASLEKWTGGQAAGFVVGGTAWGFANAKTKPGALDLLVIDEAGQFCLANTLAVSTAAQRLLLLGDPQQLPQVSQGCHGEPVNESALSWVIGHHATLPDEFGYFLNTSYRMHPAVCEVISRLSYDGKLRAAKKASQRSLDGIRPGVEVVLVDHVDRSVSCPEEAAEVITLVKAHLATIWKDNDFARALEPADFMIVTPYNAQRQLIVKELEAAGLGAVRVGTVDKFQGQEAPVVIVSMTASSHSDVPRGMDFLLNRNRVNVAISRAQWKAIVVRATALTSFMPSSTQGLLELGGFIGLGEPVQSKP